MQLLASCRIDFTCVVYCAQYQDKNVLPEAACIQRHGKGLKIIRRSTASL
jgi:hypothetical protein